MDAPPSVVAEAVEALGLPGHAHVEPAAGGASGSAWRVRSGGESFVLRRSGSARLTESRLAAMDAARRGGLPAPELVRGASTPSGNVILLTWLPGTNLLEVLSRDPAATRRWGRRMGELQRRLHEIAAPPPVVRVSADDHRPFRAGRDIVGLPSGDRLLHLDWHPLNLLVNEGSGTVTGIVDWDNARAGDPRLDLARTRGILTLDPELVSLPLSLRAELGMLLDAWADGYGREARDLPSACERWATRVMIADLEPRYTARPDTLEPLRRRLAELEANAG